jgi:hypothetical protein
MSARVPRYAFMRVLNGGTSRLQVQLFDQNGNPAQQGWVDPSQVLPSASGTGWLVASQPTVLFGSADPGASSIRDLDPFTPLSQISTTVQQGRVEVWVYRSDFGDTTARGWVDVTATGPALPPQMRVTSPISASASLPGSSSRGNAQQQQVAFVQAAGQAARVAKAQTGVPASVTVAQAILESSWGQSELATAANNYFGVKAIGSIGDDGVIWMPTSEYDDSGQLYQTLSAFRAYKSLTDSTADHDWLLETSPRYAPAMRMANDPREFAELIAEEGYSTDPDYASKLVALMDSYNLYQFDS